MAINIVAITGRLVRDPEIRQTQSGVAVCSFSVAVDRAYKSGEERQADFVDCVAWRHSAEFLGKYFGKGDMIGITGHLQTRNWETDDGQKRKATEIVVDSLSFVGGKRNAEAPAEKSQFAEITDADDALPF
mgnify:CR=1 FL=1